MHERVYMPKAAPGTYAAIRDLDATVRRSGLERPLIGAVEIWNRVAVGLNYEMPRAA